MNVCMLACITLQKSQNRLFVSSAESKPDHSTLMPFVWRKRCWLTAELQDPTHPGFSADACLIRSTTGIIIGQRILVFSSVSHNGKTSQYCSVKGRFQLPIGSYLPYNNTESCHRLPRVALRHFKPVTVNGGRSYGGKSHHESNSNPPKWALRANQNVQINACWLFGSKM